MYITECAAHDDDARPSHRVVSRDKIVRPLLRESFSVKFRNVRGSFSSLGERWKEEDGLLIGFSWDFFFLFLK